jgi:transposase InsO family protein
MPPDTNTLPIVAGGSNHNWPVYPNLAGELVLTGLDQLWGADITYIRLEVEFVYLAVVLDAFSRRMLGWALERTLPDDLSLAALRMALRARSPAPGLIHHSDQGVQYSSGDYTDALKEHQIRISMSFKANPYDKDYLEHPIETLEVGSIGTGRNVEAGFGKGLAVPVDVYLGVLWRSAGAPAGGNLLGERESGGAALLLRREQALRRSHYHGISSQTRSAHQYRADLQHLWPAHETE